MINQDIYYKYIMSKSEETLREKIIEELKTPNDSFFDETRTPGKNFIEGSFDFFIDYLKDHDVYVHCLCSTTIEESREFLAKLLNCFRIQNVNIDETLDLIKVNSLFYPQRISDWNTYEIQVISDNQEEIHLKCYYAEFREINKWEQGTNPHTYKIICHENKILWLTTPFYKEPDYFVMKNKKIYGLSKVETLYDKDVSIYICDNLDTVYKDIYFDINNLDGIIKIYKDSKIKLNDREINLTCYIVNTKTEIDLKNYFYKGFFYKGFLWDRNWEGPYFDTKVIGFEGDYLKMEVTNLTYPHTGFLLLDIEKKKIIKAAADFNKEKL